MRDRPRLDELLVARGYYPSRSRARDAVLRGGVTVNGVVAVKPAAMTDEDAEILISDAARDYVSRGALKLKHGLAHFGIEVKGRHALDIGASTGGFSQVLLEQGAAHVTAIDVGHGQMRLEDPRLTVVEGLNARDLERDHVAHSIDLIVCDVSFISLKLALPKALALAERGAVLVALVKPQFEVGRDKIGKGGIVSDASARERACRDVADFLEASGWRVRGLTPSPVAGGDGNVEYLMAARNAGG